MAAQAARRQVRSRRRRRHHCPTQPSALLSRIPMSDGEAAALCTPTDHHRSAAAVALSRTTAGAGGAPYALGRRHACPAALRLARGAGPARRYHLKPDRLAA